MNIRYSLADLRGIFDVRITASDIAEPLESFAQDEDASSVREVMDTKDFDVAGVRKNGRVSGYVEKPDLSQGTVGERARLFDVSMIVTETTGLSKLLARLRDRPQLFVLDSHHVGAIVTRADLQKAPVRLFLFGMITLIEMHFLRMIRDQFENDSWKSKARDYVDEAERVFLSRRNRNQAIDLAECLTFTGKVTVVINTRQLCRRLGFESRESAQASLERLVDLRNALAHGQDILLGLWPEIIDIVEEAERILDECEKDLREGRGSGDANGGT
jgi:hypothetical protein